MILGSDRTRLSKRHGATSIDYYREKYYLPDAMVNYLALLGWSFDEKRELFTRQALIEKFSLKKISKNPSIFDNEKMEYINAEHFKNLDLQRKTALAYDVLEREGCLPPDFEVDLSRPVDLKLIAGTDPVNGDNSGGIKDLDTKELQRLALIIKVFGNRLKLLKDIPALLWYFFRDDYPRDEVAVRTLLHDEEVLRLLGLLADRYEKLMYFDRKTVEEELRDMADDLGIQAGELIHPCRVALTGGKVSPDIFWVIVLLGKAKTVERLRGAGSAAG